MQWRHCAHILRSEDGDGAHPGHFGPLASDQTTMPAMMRKASTSTLPTHYEDPKVTEHETS